MSDFKFFVEAVLFASSTPLSEKRLSELLEQGVGVKTGSGEISASIEELNESYEKQGRSFRINKWAGGFQFATVREADDAIRPLFEEGGVRRLSRALMESLAVVSYNQPVTKPEIDNVRGVDSSYAVGKLLDTGFITISGRGEGVGNPLLYSTTDKFLEEFGLNALEDLPKIKEVEDLLRDPEYSDQAASLNEALTSLEQDRLEQTETDAQENPINEITEVEGQEESTEPES